MVVVGAANADLLTKVERRPAAGETVRGADPLWAPGGKGANQAVAAARLGADVTFIGCVGRDEHGERLRNTLTDAGANTDWLAVSDQSPTGTALVMVSPDAENAIIVTPGANRHVDIDAMRRAEPAWQDAALMIMQLELPMATIDYMADQCRRRGIRFMLNAGPAAPLSQQVLDACDPLVVNETEARFLLDDQKPAEPAELARRLCERGPKLVILTCGAAGSVAATQDRTIHQSSFPVQAVDTTGAGDGFIGGFATATTNGADLGQALVLGAKVGALAVTTLGAQAGLPTMAEVEQAFG